MSRIYLLLFKFSCGEFSEKGESRENVVIYIKQCIYRYKDEVSGNIMCKQRL